MSRLSGNDGNGSINIEIDTELYKDLIRYTDGVASQRRSIANDIFSGITNNGLTVAKKLVEERLRKRMVTEVHA